MTQHELIIREMEKLGGSISTDELRKICCQYQTRLRELREKGFNISMAIRCEKRKGNNIYRLLGIPPAPGESVPKIEAPAPDQFKVQGEFF